MTALSMSREEKRPRADVAWGTARRPEERIRGKQRQLDLDSAALMVEEVLITEEIQDGPKVSDTRHCLTGKDGLRNLLEHCSPPQMNPKLWLQVLSTWSAVCG